MTDADRDRFRNWWQAYGYYVEMRGKRYAAFASAVRASNPYMAAQRVRERRIIEAGPVEITSLKRVA